MSRLKRAVLSGLAFTIGIGQLPAQLTTTNPPATSSGGASPAGSAGAIQVSNGAGGLSAIPQSTFAASNDPRILNSTTPKINMVAAGADSTGAADSAAVIRSVVASLGTTPATLYFPKGTYRFASTGPNGAEECVRINTSISLLGDGPGQTIFTDDASPVCLAQIGYGFSNSQVIADNNYSWETDTGYPVDYTTAALGSAALTLTTHSNASLYAAGQYVYVRGDLIFASPNTNRHGELNRIVSSNSTTGVVTIAWPLSSDYTQETGGVQLNLVSNSEIIKDIQISGFTFNFHDEALLGAQILGLHLFNNQFNYLGSTAGTETFQHNNVRSAEINNNVINNALGLTIDPARSSNSWIIHDNTLNGPLNFGEGGSNFNVYKNVITCVNRTVPCITLGGSSGDTVDSNVISVVNASDGFGITDLSGSVTSPRAVISNNRITAKATRAITAGTPGTRIFGNTITTDLIGYDIQSGGIQVTNNSVTLIGSGYIGMLIEGTSHSDVVNGFNCSVATGASGYACLYIGDQGTQTTPPPILDNITGSGLSNGILVANATHDSPILGKSTFQSTSTPYTGINPPLIPSGFGTPASSTAACTVNQFQDDANYHYVCVATNTWKRVALVSF